MANFHPILFHDQQKDIAITVILIHNPSNISAGWMKSTVNE